MSYANELQISFGEVYETVDEAIDNHSGILNTFYDVLDLLYDNDRALYDRFINFAATVEAVEVGKE